MGNPEVDTQKEGAGSPKGCVLSVSRPWRCEDGYWWITFTCEEHGTSWREVLSGRGTAMRSCTTRALGTTLAGYRVFRSLKELERWLSGEDDEGPSDEDDGSDEY